MAVLPDVLAPGLAVVFCGSGVGEQSARAGAYYAGRGNKFWPVLHETGLTPRRLAPSEFRVLLEFGIGLTDLVKTASGADSVFARSDFDTTTFESKIECFAPRIVAFNGKRAAQEYLKGRASYGKQDRSIAGSAVYVLPSTSGAASGFWDIAYWNALAEDLNDL